MPATKEEVTQINEIKTGGLVKREDGVSYAINKQKKVVKHLNSHESNYLRKDTEMFAYQLINLKKGQL